MLEYRKNVCRQEKKEVGSARRAISRTGNRARCINNTTQILSKNVNHGQKIEKGGSLPRSSKPF